MQVCSKCQVQKEAHEFAAKGLDCRHSHCKQCQRVISREHYARNKEEYRTRIKAKQRALRALVSELKKGPCVDCGQCFHPWQMDFDHRPGSGKQREIAAMVSHGTPWEVIAAEIAKCDLVCANCHRHRTYLRSHGS